MRNGHIDIVGKFTDENTTKLVDYVVESTRTTATGEKDRNRWLHTALKHRVPFMNLDAPPRNYTPT